MISATYDDQREAILGLLERPNVTGAEPVPACPGWSVADVARHLTGLADDWLTGQLDVYASPEWTVGQVARFADRSSAEVATEWRDRADAFAAILDDPGSADHLPDTIRTVVGSFPTSTFPSGIVVDATIHNADVHEAIGIEPPISEAALVGAVGSMANSLRMVWKLNPALPTMTARTTDTGQEVRLRGADDRQVAVTASTYDLFRSFGGRRTIADMLALDWSGPERARAEAAAAMVVPFFALPS